MIGRRSFLSLLGALALPRRGRAEELDLATLDRGRILRAADRHLEDAPITVTAATSPRSAGRRHDYFSEGDYWWPDPENPAGPYIQRDGMSNPDTFNAHREALRRLSLVVPALVAAWSLTREERYGRHAACHLRAWFLDAGTRMNPHLLYAQAIKGRVTGRGIGIIDTIHLVEVVRAISVLERGEAMSREEHEGVRSWFTRYLAWMTTHPYGRAERDAENNHGTCWVMQVAEFARYTADAELTAFCRERYRSVLVPGQIAPDGSFPRELRRTKPYGYTLFNLDAFATVCQILSTPADDLWRFETPDGRGIGRALEFAYPYIADKSKWPYPPDVMYFEEWPVRHPCLLFGGRALDRPHYLALWRTLEADPVVDEVLRNTFVRQPVLWSS